MATNQEAKVERICNSCGARDVSESNKTLPPGWIQWPYWQVVGDRLCFDIYMCPNCIPDEIYTAAGSVRLKEYKEIRYPPASAAVRMRGMKLRPPHRLGVNLRTLFAVSAIVAIVCAGPSLIRFFGPIASVVGLLLFALVAFIQTAGKWRE
jgi:hypothetical protein